MKKNVISIILLIIVLVAIPIVISSDYKNTFDLRSETFPDLPKDEKWEYVKDRLFDGETPYVQKLEGPILFTLENATKEDSLLVESAMQEIRAIIPNKKIDFYEAFIGKSPAELGYYMAKKRKPTEFNHDEFYKGFNYFDIIQSAINLGFNTETQRKMLSDIIPDHQYYPVGEFSTVIHKESNSNTLRGGNIHFLIENNEIEDPYLQSLITAHIMKSLCKIQNNRRGTEQVASIYGLTGKHSFITTISENDKFLLHKLYAPDFIEQFKTYLYKTYPWHYAQNFINKLHAKTYATWTVIFLGIFFFIIGFNLSNKKYRNKYFNYLIPTIVLILSLTVLFITYSFMTSKHQAGSTSIFYLYVTPMFIGSVIALLLYLFDKYVINNRMNFTVQLLCKIIFTFIVFMLPITILSITEIKNDNWYFLNKFGLPVLTIALLRGLFIYLNRFSENLIKQKDLELSQLQEVNSQAEVKLLQSQINPHFLYNALNSIASLAHKNADKTEQMALSLSDLFKYTINRQGKKDSTIGDEVEMVKNYLEVEQIRFDDRLRFDIDVDPVLEHTTIPMFLIQPLIENAVKHGISKVQDNGQITLCIQRSHTGFLIIVEDNGPDWPEGLVSGHGLQTVFDLIRLTYGDKASISWKNTPTKHIKITIDQ